jgi:hypothetical protein
MVVLLLEYHFNILLVDYLKFLQFRLQFRLKCHLLDLMAMRCLNHYILIIGLNVANFLYEVESVEIVFDGNMMVGYIWKWVAFQYKIMKYFI